MANEKYKKYYAQQTKALWHQHVHCAVIRPEITLLRLK